MSDTDHDNVLSQGAAKLGVGLLMLAVVLGVLLSFPFVPSSLKDGTVLLGISNMIPFLSGATALIGAVQQKSVQNGTKVVVIVLATSLVLSLVIALLGESETTKTFGQDALMIISSVCFFILSSGLDDVLNACTKWIHYMGLILWVINLLSMLSIALWTGAHLADGDGDGVLSVSFAVVYAIMGTKYLSLAITSVHHNSRARIVLLILAGLVSFLGWVSLVGRDIPGCPVWVINASLFAAASLFGTSYGFNTVLKNKLTFPKKDFVRAVWLAAIFAVVVGFASLLPAIGGLSAVISLLFQETWTNLVGGSLDLISEIDEERPVGALRWYRPSGWLRFYAKALGWTITGLIFLCGLSIFQPALILVAGGVTVVLLQSVPWIRLGQWSALTWSSRPSKALFSFLATLTVVGAIGVAFGVMIAMGPYSVTDKVALWYSIARLPSAVSLGYFCWAGLSIGQHKGWKTLLMLTLFIIGGSFIWWMVAIFFGGISAVIGPSIVLQIAGGMMVATFTAQIGSARFGAWAQQKLDQGKE